MKIVVSLTTVPIRLCDPNPSEAGTKLGLTTIVEQTYPEYEIHFNIPYSYKMQEIQLPDWLLEYTVKYPHLKVFRTPDFGPITKLYPTLLRETDPDTIIITADDDLYYMDGLIPAHLEGMKKYPGCALGFAGMDEIGGCHRRFITSLPQDVRVKMLEGYKTISYKRSFFDTDFEEFAFCQWNDDVAISAYLGYKNIKKYVLCYEGETDFSPRVESFPVIKHTPIGESGCRTFRSNDDVVENGNTVANRWYKLQYLER